MSVSLVLSMKPGRIRNALRAELGKHLRLPELSMHFEAANISWADCSIITIVMRHDSDIWTLRDGSGRMTASASAADSEMEHQSRAGFSCEDVLRTRIDPHACARRNSS